MLTERRLSGYPSSNSKSTVPLGYHEKDLTFTKPLPGKLELWSILVGSVLRNARQIILLKLQERLTHTQDHGHRHGRHKGIWLAQKLGYED